ncbi:MAG TPA: hypothetical protein VMZ73_02740 [Acidimicrobiales bacterium]|nr:hypothetical protein [Acidimicrobiales bacterium]
MDFSKLTLGNKIVLGAGVLLILDLLFFPWHNVSVGGIVDVNRTGVQSPNSFYGVLALLLALVMVAQVVVSKLTTAKLPDIPLPWSRVHLIAGIAVLALLLLKLLVETSFLGFGAFLGLILAAALAYGGYTISQEGPSAAGEAF